MEVQPHAALRDDVDLAAALTAAARHGWAHVADALDADFRTRLQSEIAAGPFGATARDVGPVYQEMDSYVVVLGEGGEFVLAEHLGLEFGRRVRQAGAGIDGLDGFAPNEMGVQRYAPGSAGITPHRDGTRFRPLLAVFTTRGCARFTVHPAREAEPSAACDVTPGDLVLLRGPGLGGASDGRPMHAVSGPTGDEARYSVSVRTNAEAAA